jgi:hypothetical protein
MMTGEACVAVCFAICLYSLFVFVLFDVPARLVICEAHLVFLRFANHEWLCCAFPLCIINLSLCSVRHDKRLPNASAIGLAEHEHVWSLLLLV